MSQMASVLLNMILVLICVNLSIGCIVLPISLRDNSVGWVFNFSDLKNSCFADISRFITGSLNLNYIEVKMEIKTF